MSREEFEKELDDKCVAEFGEWLKNLPKLEPTNTVEGREARMHKLPPSKDRWKLRSITYQGIADAMASQWETLAEVIGEK